MKPLAQGPAADEWVNQDEKKECDRRVQTSGLYLLTVFRIDGLSSEGG